MQTYGTPTSSPRAAIYVRVSTEDQEDNSSLESQRAACQQLADEQGFSVVAHYRDVQSGAAFDRKQLNAMLDAIQSRELDTVICYHLDRLARDPELQYYVLGHAKRYGAGIVFVQNPPADTQGDRLLRFFEGWKAGEERVDLVRRTQSGIRQRVKAGHYLPGSRAPYGYRFVNPEPAEVDGKRQPAKTRLERDKATAPVVERMYAYVAAGQSVNSLAQLLTSERLPTPTEHVNGLSVGSKRWDRSTLRAILRNPLYKGQPEAYRYKIAKPHRAKVKVPLEPIKEPVPLKDVAPALVSAEQWQQANDQLDRNRRELSSTRATPQDTLLRAGYVVCGHCGRPMTVARSKRADGRVNTSYRCMAPNGEHEGKGVSITSHSASPATLLIARSGAESWTCSLTPATSSSTCGNG